VYGDFIRKRPHAILDDMNDVIVTGGILQIWYIKQSDVDRLKDLNGQIFVILKASKAWTELDYVPESASLTQQGMSASSSIPYNYMIKVDIGGMTEANMRLVHSLLTEKYMVKCSDTNGNVWLMGNKRIAGKWAQSIGKVGENLISDNEILLSYTTRDTKPLQKVE